MEPPYKKFRLEDIAVFNFEAAETNDDEQSDVLSDHGDFDSEAETVASSQDPPDDHYELLDWWVVGPSGPGCFLMKLNVEDEMTLTDWCLVSESWFPGGYILDSEPLLFKAQRDEERWGF